MFILGSLLYLTILSAFIICIIQWYNYKKYNHKEYNHPNNRNIKTPRPYSFRIFNKQSFPRKYLKIHHIGSFSQYTPGYIHNISDKIISCYKLYSCYYLEHGHDKIHPLALFITLSNNTLDSFIYKYMIKDKLYNIHIPPKTTWCIPLPLWDIRNELLDNKDIITSQWGIYPRFFKLDNIEGEYIKDYIQQWRGDVKR